MSPPLSPVQQERMRLVEAAMRALVEAPFEVLRARGVVRGFYDFRRLVSLGPAWLLTADDDAAAAFFLLVEEAHATSEAALAASAGTVPA